jgi:hypothetical protein
VSSPHLDQLSRHAGGGNAAEIPDNVFTHDLTFYWCFFALRP